MKVLFVTKYAEMGASSRDRVYQYLPFLKKEGIQYTLCPVIPNRILKIWFGQHRVPALYRKLLVFLDHWPFAFLKYLRVALIAHSYDIVYIQKVLMPVPIQKIVGSLCPNVVFDFDDALFASPRDYSIYRFVHQLEASTRVVAGNDYLREYACKFNRNVDVIPTAIDISKFQPRCVGEDNRDRIVIGWVGNGPAHLDNLRLVRKPLKILGESYNLLFRIIGAMGSRELRNALQDATSCDIDFVDWLDPQKVPEEIAQFDIGIMPLKDDEFLKGKCARKALEYMAMAIPTVVSPVGMNSELIQDGVNGYLASTNEEWVEKLSLLVESTTLRQRLGQAGRKTVEEKYSLTLSASRFITLLNECASR